MTPDFRKKILSLDQLVQACPSGTGMVFTNGCFDLLHLGHVTYLAQARSLGDFLVVALNDDASITRLKGPTRPVHSLADRAGVIAALASVDYVISFGSDTPLHCIQQLRPQWLVKGGDYAPRAIVGAQEVPHWGGQVKCLPFVEGYSSSAVIARLLNQSICGPADQKV